jgi:hypothetical protein
MNENVTIKGELDQAFTQDITDASRRTSPMHRTGIDNRMMKRPMAMKMKRTLTLTRTRIRMVRPARPLANALTPTQNRSNRGTMKAKPRVRLTP